MSRLWRLAVVVAAAIAAVAVLLGPRTVPATLLLVLPGGWLVSGRSTESLPIAARLALAVVLTPLVLALQLVVLRAVGVAFPLACWLGVVLNLPVLFRMRRVIPNPAGVDRRAMVEQGIVFAMIVVALLPQLMSPQGAAYAGHAWWHADVMYQVANGGLVLDDPELAGIRMGYAWIGHLYQVVPGYVAGISPLVSYAWHNVVWLLATCLLVGHLVVELGGRRRALVTATAWLAFGVNAAGYLLHSLLRLAPLRHSLGSRGSSLAAVLAFGGDWRITPWLLKYYFLHQMSIGIGSFAAVLYLLVRQRSEPDRPAGGEVLILSLLVSVGLIYPVLFPAVAATVAVAVALDVSLAARARLRPRWGDALRLTMVLLAATAVTYVGLRFVTRDRVTSAVSLAAPRAMRHHALVAAAAFLPFLAALPFVLRAGWHRHRRGLLLLALSGAASLALYVGAAIPGGGLEYKFVFTAAVALTPFAAIGTERLLQRLTPRGWLQSALLAVLVLLLALPLVHKLRSDGWSRLYIPALDPARLASYPALDLDRFDTRLAPGEPYAALLESVRTRTPVATVLVTRDTAIHFPTLTQRSMFVAPAQVASSYPGINVPMDQVLTDMRGYDPAVVASRRAAVQRLFTAATDAGRASALPAVMLPGRPAAIILELPGDSGLAGWLARQPAVPLLHRDSRHAAWLVERPAPVSP